MSNKKKKTDLLQMALNLMSLSPSREEVQLEREKWPLVPAKKGYKKYFLSLSSRSLPNLI
jgi:hypothetical protein